MMGKKGPLPSVGSPFPQYHADRDKMSRTLFDFFANFTFYLVWEEEETEQRRAL